VVNIAALREKFTIPAVNHISMLKLYVSMLIAHLDQTKREALVAEYAERWQPFCCRFKPCRQICEIFVVVINYG